MKAKQESRRQRQEIEALGDPDLLRLFEIQEKYTDPDDPAALLIAQMAEIARQNAVRLGVCDDCVAKFPDPLAEKGAKT